MVAPSQTFSDRMRVDKERVNTNPAAVLSAYFATDIATSVGHLPDVRQDPIPACH